MSGAAHLLRYARRRAGLTQRALAAGSGVAQPTIARIEAGRSEPRFSLLQKLLGACDQQLVLDRRRGQGIDRSTMRESLEQTPLERAVQAAREARNLSEIDRLNR